MKMIQTSEYPIRYIAFKNEGVIIENEIQVNRGGYELFHYYNTHGKGSISVEICNYAGIDYLVFAHAELDREDIRDRKQKGFSKRYVFYEEAKKVAITKIEEFEKWIDSNIIWKITREKYCKGIHKKAVKEYKKQVMHWNWQSDKYKAMNELLNPLNNKQFIINCYEDIYMQDHKRAVMEAIKEEKDVPEKVIRGYGFNKKELKPDKRYIVNGVIKTQFGREISAPPCIRLDMNRKVIIDLKKLDNWLLKNIKEEVAIRNDDYNQIIFNGMKGKLTTTDRSMINQYLFGETNPTFYTRKS